MIAKGTTHNNGAKLARYLLTGKEGERAEFWQKVGFAADDLRDAFRSVHVMAAATRCEQPFFHVQVRNPENEELSRLQWNRVANRIEDKLGLTNQPRAICFHIDENTGHEHMHVAWSRISTDTMRAVPLPFFKERLKEVCRELEKTLDLTRVKNERDGSVRAPNRNEFEQARRLGVDIKAVRQSIRDCWDRSDCGRSFEAALAEHGWVLAQGDRRAFLVIDHEGGIHALGKRILGVTAAQIRDRFGDFGRDELPTVDQARSFLREQRVNREKGQQTMPDRYREEMAWQDALAKAAIEKEKIERQFAEPKKEPESPFAPPQVKGFAAEIRDAYYYHARNPRKFAAALEPKAQLACVTKEEADRSHRDAAFAKAIGRFVPVYRAGDIVVIKEPGLLHRRNDEIVETGRVYRLDRRTTGEDDPARLKQFLGRFDRKQLQGIDATKGKLNMRAAERADRWDAIRLENAQRGRRSPGTFSRGKGVPTPVKKIGGRAVAKTLETVGDLFAEFLAPKLTPEQKRAGERSERRRRNEGENEMDYFRYQAHRAEERRREEQERENRSRGGGGRDR